MIYFISNKVYDMCMCMYVHVCMYMYTYVHMYMFKKTHISDTYRCAPGFHMMGGDEAMETYEICMGANLTCMNDLMNRMGE